MKKLLVWLMILCLPAAAMAETVTANGVAESDAVLQVTAPWSGVLKPFDWKTGDAVSAQDVLFSMDVTCVYAPVDGKVAAVFAENGDLAVDVLSQYGMLASMEKAQELIVTASVTGAYNDEENRTIHLGETVYLEQTNDRDNEGEGRVTAIDGDRYVVELSSGEFDNGDPVKVYRDEKMLNKSCIGSGKISRADNVNISGVGRVLRCAVREGEMVQKGQLLFELAAQDAEPGLASADLKAGVDGMLEVAAMSGQQVYKGQVLARVHDLSVMNVVAEVDEMDLDLIRVGDALNVVLDRYPDHTVSGVVREIAGIGKPRQNATYYDVTIELNTMLEVLPGMNATVWLSRE